MASIEATGNRKEKFSRHGFWSIEEEYKPECVQLLHV